MIRFRLCCALYQQYFFNTHVRINLDMLKTRHREHILVRACIEAKQPFVVDNTNVLIEERARYITLAKPDGFRIIGYYFRPHIQQALEWNSRRSGKAVVPIKGIWGTYKRLQQPRLSEGFDQLYYVESSASNTFIVQPSIK
jgi:predicted kinase